MKKVPKLTHSRLKEMLSYDPETGVFHRLKPVRLAKVGDVCGYQDQIGYIRMRLDGELIWAHRLAWFYVHGTWPTKCIDHINRNRGDNRLANLRDVPHSVNMQNRTPFVSRERAGWGVVPLLGVTLHKDRTRFRAQITRNGRSRKLGCFDTAEEAHQAYVVAASQHQLEP